MELDDAIKLLKIHYEAAKNLELVHNPIAYALYQTWRMADRKFRKGDK